MSRYESDDQGKSAEISSEEFQKNLRFINQLIRNCEGKLPKTMKVALDYFNFCPKKSEVWITCIIRGYCWVRAIYIGINHHDFKKELEHSFNLIYHKSKKSSYFEVEKEFDDSLSVSLDLEKKSIVFNSKGIPEWGGRWG